LSGLNYSLPGIYFLLHSSLLLILTPAATLAHAAENALQRAYPVPEHGELILNVPASWEVTYFSPGETRPPVITFYKKVFSLFTHDQDSLLQEKTLKMIQTAIHRFQRHI
jgi:hypothetical protein